MEILIISGLSGSGKSRAATFLEDIGYYIVDNLPAEMMLKFANFCSTFFFFLLVFRLIAKLIETVELIG